MYPPPGSKALVRAKCDADEAFHCAEIARIRALRNTVAPISALPLELLSYIFILATENLPKRFCTWHNGSCDDAFEEYDDDFRDDPISNIDLKARICILCQNKKLTFVTRYQEHLISFLKECAARNTNNFAAVVDQLKVEEAVVVRAAISS